MPQPWLVGIEKRNRRGVEKDFRHYDRPGLVWEKINLQTWDYSKGDGSRKRVRRNLILHLRDLAMMCILYWTGSRISEVVRARIYQLDEDKVLQYIGPLPSLKASQFVYAEPDFINLRGLRIIKRKVKHVDDYGVRMEIRFPLTGDLSKFTDPVVQYLDLLIKDKGPDAELFPFKKHRGYQIVEHSTQIGKKNGLMPHYLREMGLKFRLRLYDRNIKQLKVFSGHKHLENLLRYLDELEDPKAILDYKIEEM